MRNKIVVVSAQEFKTIKKELQDDDNIFWIEIDGIKCEKRKAFFDVISEIIRAPIPIKGFAGYDDWMTDLSWISQEKIVFVIYRYDEFLKGDLEAKKNIIFGFTDLILPWWDTEVCYHTVGGKPRQFDVYLVFDFEKQLGQT